MEAGKGPGIREDRLAWEGEALPFLKKIWDKKILEFGCIREES